MIKCLKISKLDITCNCLLLCIHVRTAAGLLEALIQVNLSFCPTLPTGGSALTCTDAGGTGMIIERLFFCLCRGLTSQSTIFQSCWDGATASWVLPVLSGSKVSCSRTQHGGGRFRSPDLSLLSPTLYH